jgi:hypothetical protein
VLEHLVWDEAAAEVVYSARPSHRDGASDSVARWDVLEFLARVLDHLPEPRQQLVRTWGWYSNASRGGRRRRQGESGTTPRRHTESGAEAQSRRLSWSQLIRKVYEIDPLLCTFCGAAMRIVAFIVERSSLRRLLKNRDYDCQQPEPLAHSPPAEAEPICALA